VRVLDSRHGGDPARRPCGWRSSFVNNFFARITAESLRGSKCVIDKCIGDEVMVVFSKDFGSEESVQ